jgi:hypothetical protein
MANQTGESMIVNPNEELARPKVRVMVGIPTHNQVSGGFAFDLAKMVGFMAAQRPDVEVRVVMNHGSIIPQQRHTLVKKALDLDMTHILFLDSDMRFPPDTLDALLAHNESFVAVNYTTRRMPIYPTARVMSADKREFHAVYQDESDEGLREVDLVGLGVALIDLDVFRHLPKPWFMFMYHPELDDYTGEDFFFSHHARNAGVKILVDQSLSYEIKHVGETEFRHDMANALLEQIEGGRDGNNDVR